MTSSLSNANLYIERAYIDGKWIDAPSGQRFDVFNPSNGWRIATLPDMSAADVAVASQAASRAFQTWKATSCKVRGDIIRKWALLMNENASDLAALITLENGKPYAEARAEVGFAASYLEFYSGEVQRTYGDVVPCSNTTNRVFAVKQPIGVVACLTPWNFPAAMVTRKAGAAIAAGCTAVVKPAGETSLTALAIAYLAEQAGLPKGVLNVITSMKNLAFVGKALCEDPIIKKLSFTGSTAIGQLLMAQSATTLKKLSLELGGNSPFIIFEDSDLDEAVKMLLAAKVRNSGQTCVCANRVYVQRTIHDQLCAKLVEVFKQMKVADGFEKGVQIGPLTTKRGVEKAAKHVKDAVSKGAQLLHGGKPLPGDGQFFEPTVLAGMSAEMLSHSEEIFAPVVALYAFGTEAEVVEMANNSDVGLGSYVCTKDGARQWRLAEKLEAGMVGLNTGIISGGEIPFGGVKHSGFGLEGGKWGVQEYMITKTIVMAVGDD